MGLDITVYRITKKPVREDDYFDLDDEYMDIRNSFPAWTKALENKVVEKWYDYEKYKEQTGIDLDDYEIDMNAFLPNEESYMLVHKKGEDLQCDDSEDNPDFVMGQCSKLQKKILYKDIPLMEHETTILYREEVGYQRKGLNSKFYEDYSAGKIGYLVCTLDELKRYKEEYCDEPHVLVYPNGEKSDIMVYEKDNFQRNIIDNFIEGECVVTFGW